MATTLTPTVSVSLTGSRRNTIDNEVANVTLNEVITFAFTNGVGDAQVDMLWSDTRTLEASASDTLDLAGVLADVFGQTQTFVTVKGILVYSTLGENKVLTVGGGAGNFQTWVAASGDAVKVQPGGLMLLVAPNTGYGVTPTSGDTLVITNASGGSSTYKIFLLGTSA